MPRITFDEDRPGGRRERVVEVTLRKREYGGYDVVRKDTGHQLGWVVQSEEDGKKVWQGRAGRDPFLPQGLDILAKLKADVPYGSGEEGSGRYRAVVRDASRGWVVSKLVQHLASNWAVALDPIDVKAVQAELDAVETEVAECRENLTWAEEHGRPVGELDVLRRYVARLGDRAEQWRCELDVAEAAHSFDGYWDTSEARELCRVCRESTQSLAHRQLAA